MYSDLYRGSIIPSYPSTRHETMETVTTFTPYPFTVGEKIHISAGKRRGDWLVTHVKEQDVTLQCPISKKEFTWKNFCYLTEKGLAEWPR